MTMPITFRPATLDDAAMLFGWRNDPATRANSHNTGEVAFDSHVSWLSATLQNPMRQLLIAEEGGRPVGTVRIDHDADSAELSWTVAPGERRRGVAKRMVSSAVDGVARMICAEVKAGNVASMKVAEAAGMRLVRLDGEVLHYQRQAAP